MGLGRPIEKLPHSCGTKHGLQVFAQEDGRVDGWCYRCNTFVRHPYGEEKVATDLPAKRDRTPEEVAAELAEISGYQTLTVEQRKLRAATLNQFDAKVSVSVNDGVTPTAIYWPVKRDGKLTGYHVKILNPLEGYGKAFFVGNVKDCDLLNWDKAKTSGARRLIITEGPEDMASVHRIYEMNIDDPKWMPAVVSLPMGAGSAKHYIQKHAAEIKKFFKEVVLCFDNDEAGQKAVKEAVITLPEAKTVTLPFKDANECLVEGASKAAYKQLSFHAISPKNTSLIFSDAIHVAAREPAKWGELSWPFPTLNDLTRGIRYGETYYIGAGVKMGKSEFRDELAAHFIKENQVKVFMASFEEAVKKTYRKIAGKVSSRFFNDPKREFDFDAYDKAGEILSGSLALLDVYQRADKDAIKSDITAAAEWGAKAVFIDPITNFTNGVAAGESNTILQGMAQELSFLARDLELAVFIFCHLKEPEGNLSKDSRRSAYDAGRHIGLGNCPHEYGGDIMSAQFAGSRGMMRSCNYMIGIEGNKDPELDADIRNIRNIKLLEDREFGEAGIIPVYWNNVTGRFTEI